MDNPLHSQTSDHEGGRRYTEQEEQDARENPHRGDVWEMDPRYPSTWQRRVLEVEPNGSVLFEASMGDMRFHCRATADLWMSEIQTRLLLLRGPQ